MSSEAPPSSDSGASVPLPRRTSVRWGFLLALACAVIWGSQFPVAKAAYAVVDVFHVNAIRYGGALLLLLPLLAWREDRTALRYEGRGRRATLVGVCGLCGSPMLVYGGLTFTRPEIVAVIVATQPAMTALALWWARRQRPARFTLATILIAFLGVITVVTGWRLDFIADSREVVGSLLVILGACAWVFYTIQLDAFPGWSALRLSTLLTLPGTIGLFCVLATALALGVAHSPDAAGWWQALPALAYLSFVSVFVAMLMWTRAVREIGSLNGMLMLNLIPVTTFAIGYAQGKPLHWVEAIGALLVIAALIANNLYLRVRQRRLARHAPPTIKSP